MTFYFFIFISFFNNVSTVHHRLVNSLIRPHSHRGTHSEDGEEEEEEEEEVD